MMVYNCVLMHHSGLCRFTTHHWLTMWQTLDLLTFHDLFVILRRFLKANRFIFREYRETWERTYLRLKAQRNSPCRITRSLSFWIHFLWGSLAIGWSDPGCFWWLKPSNEMMMYPLWSPINIQKSLRNHRKTSILLRSTEKNQLFNFINHHQPVHIGLLKYPWPIAARNADGMELLEDLWILTTKNGALISNKCWLKQWKWLNSPGNSCEFNWLNHDSVVA